MTTPHTQHDKPSTVLLYFSGDARPACELAAQLQIACLEIERHCFPDQESRVRVPADSYQQVIIYQSLDHPNNKLIELMFACQTLREQGTAQIILVAPYLCYMRQDIAFEPGQAVSQNIIGKFLASLVDGLITVDPHLHRTPELVQAVPTQTAIALSSAQLQAEFIQGHYSDALLMGPDQESEQWVAGIAQYAGLEYRVASKQRLGDRSVRISLPGNDYRGRRILLIDDIASTGQTLANCAQQLLDHQATELKAMVTHALFTDETEQRLGKAGITEIWSTDSIEHPSNRISLRPLLADCLQGFV